jgi:hypothetical protein
MPDQPDDTIEIAGLSLAISADALAALLRPTGGEGMIELRLSDLRARVPKAALTTLINALMPADEGGNRPLDLTLAPGALGATVTVGGRRLAVSVPARRLALAVEEDGLRLEGE